MKLFVIFNIGSVPTVIKDGEKGILVPKGDIKSLSESIIRIEQDSKLKKKIEEEGRKTAVREFSLESMAEGTIKVYEKVLEIGNQMI
ncbi:MAG: glycosyltransferase [bacterium]